MATHQAIGDGPDGHSDSEIEGRKGAPTPPNAISDSNSDHRERGQQDAARERPAGHSHWRMLGR
jgi:hypothetical protein